MVLDGSPRLRFVLDQEIIVSDWKSFSSQFTPPRPAMPLRFSFRSLLCLQIIQAHHVPITIAVNGSVTAQYTQNLPFSTCSPEPALQLKSGIAKNAATQVPGRNAVVKTAIVFIEALSCWLASAMAFESRAIEIFEFESFCAMRL